MIRYAIIRYVFREHPGRDPLTSGHVAAAAVIAIIFALGGTVRLLEWSLPHRSHWWAAILLVVLVTTMIRTRNTPVRRR